MDINTEFPQEVIEKAYEAIELARKTGKIKKGTNEATKAAERGNAKLIVVAKDTTPKEIIMHIPMLCEEKNILCVIVPSREDLGAAAGLNIPTSSVAILQEGEAKEAIKFIAQRVRGE